MSLKPSNHSGTEELALNPAKNYPRKRVAVACEVCRLRKTKCDAKRPCSFCTEAGIECVYRQSGGVDTKGTSATDVLVRIEERLARVEETLQRTALGSPSAVSDARNSVNHAHTPGSSSLRRASNSTTGEPISLAARLQSRDDLKQYFQRIVSVPHYEFSFRQTAGEAIAARPSMLSFRATWYINFESWDDTKDFYDDELVAEEYLFQLMEAGFGQSLDVSSRTVWQLQQHFVNGFLQWLPVITISEFTNHVEIARNGNFARQSPSDCIVMFALAIGSLDKTRHSSASRSLERPHPGLEYFSIARDILMALSKRSRKRDITILQCRILQVCYWNMILRPLLAWDGITEVARDCMHILSSGTLERLSHKDKLNFHRIFWTCSVVLHELEAVLKMHPIGLRQFHESVPLPLAESDDDGHMYFLAQASLRKLLTETLDVVGYRVGQIIYAPVVAAELCSQVEEWYDHLPPGIHFPLTTSPLYDLRRAFLRFQYLTLHSVIFWPSILQLLEYNASNANGEVNSPERLQQLQKDASHFVEYSQKVCDASEELLMVGHYGLQFTIWASYANACMLMIIYRTSASSFLPESLDDRCFRKVHRLLTHWKDIKVVWRVLKRSRPIFTRLGLKVDDQIP
ncbi:hypothetical protein, variant 2 [Verruconis gallopava]|uniref:Zn(2)-C6 fungal-type domain-containing protein n=1 Tax=Verruconis gallopava TaxID=253628 RepID=A0A0D1XFT1_9PEZI|nr:hypothetical protein, variant 2 [Verruconis gallopava]KIW01031.1 hypothetical protein, variant 2 [Verruconis gallopava]